jgi:hypothetical protein
MNAVDANNWLNNFIFCSASLLGDDSQSSKEGSNEGDVD